MRCPKCEKKMKNCKCNKSLTIKEKAPIAKANPSGEGKLEFKSDGLHAVAQIRKNPDNSVTLQTGVKIKTKDGELNMGFSTTGKG